MGVEGYMGLPLFGSSGDPLGLLVVMNNKPFSTVSLAESMMKIFGARAAAELERKLALEELERATEDLQSILRSVTDTIMAIDEERRIRFCILRLKKCLGIARRNWLGRRLKSCFHRSRNISISPGSSPPLWKRKGVSQERLS
jgi:PAS domain-containing protein